MNDYYGLDDFPRNRVWEAFEAYRDAREAYWISDDQADSLRRGYDQLAAMFMEVASELVSGSGEAEEQNWRRRDERIWAEFLETLDQHDEIAVLFDQAVEMRVYELTLERLEGARERCFQLASFVLNTRPNRPVEKYLRRLSACYIAGLLPECVILCRAILENAVSDTFRRHRVTLPQNEAGVSSMRTRLGAARTRGWLTKEGLDGAWRVWLRGNKAVHEDPHATDDVYGTLVLTSRVLSELYGHR